MWVLDIIFLQRGDFWLKICALVRSWHDIDWLFLSQSRPSHIDLLHRTARRAIQMPRRSFARFGNWVAAAQPPPSAAHPHARSVQVPPHQRPLAMQASSYSAGILLNFLWVYNLINALVIELNLLFEILTEPCSHYRHTTTPISIRVSLVRQRTMRHFWALPKDWVKRNPEDWLGQKLINYLATNMNQKLIQVRVILYFLA